MLNAAIRRLPALLPSLNGQWLTSALAVLLLLPLLSVVLSFSQPQGDIWQHLAETVLASYISNSIILALGVGIGTFIVGTSLAWICSRYEFPLRRLISGMVLLPLAIPAYIIAYCYTGFLDYAGPVQSSLRSLFGWHYGDYWFPQIRSMGGAISMLTLVLYPYVYLLARNAFSEQSASLYEASRALGHSHSRYILKVAIPLARPAILAGVALAMMEAFADFGTVQYFGVNTFTTGIFRIWFGMGNSIAAAQLSALLVGFVLVLLLLEKYSRRKIEYYYLGVKTVKPARIVVRGSAAFALTSYCLLPVILGFGLPFSLLLNWAVDVGWAQLDARFISAFTNSFYLAALASVLIVTLAIIFGYARRLKHRLALPAINLASMGYAVPGTVIAVGVIVPLSGFDKALDAFLMTTIGFSSGLLLSGSLFALLFAYAVRFLAVALHQVDVGLGRIKPSMDQAARSLGLKQNKVLTKIHIPIMRASLFSALMLVFVDVLKELPATLILRPFNFNTLAVKAYELASDERLHDAALPALTIVLISIIPVILLTRAIHKYEQDHAQT